MENQKRTSKILSFTDTSREVSTSELKEIAEILRGLESDEAQKLYIHIVTFNFDPVVFKGWSELAAERYDYHALFFSPIEEIPLTIGAFEELDEVEKAIVQYRLDHSE